MLDRKVRYSLEQLSDAIRQLVALPFDARAAVELEVLSHEVAIPRSSFAPVQTIEPGPFMRFRRDATGWRGSFDLELLEHEELGPAVQQGAQLHFHERSRVQHPSRNWIIGVDVTVSKMP